ncbi:glycerol-3-phosphate o-acyltransferase [Diplodia corticola]|uniref:Glycerol-3-phosphate o-acyltransferase n=1 Tax=Diplodia corticola TaxID=236234 RepID=A0A1J9RF47_9PEZI|nr:glycerol-3-phosphate o-acyltransferase [Diplodia corticola]OJD31187.1 glycerol-3-phosphate o-acyltransferase [Diplodia corticola]
MAPKQHRRLLVPWIYDIGCFIFTLCLDIFFREVYPRNAWRVPARGPVIIIAAPHANQFVDSALLMRILKHHAGRRVSFLIADKSMREPYIGALASRMGALPVVRAMDHIKPGPGKIYLPDPEGDPTLVRGQDVDFTSSQFMVGGSIILPKVGGESPEQQSIAEILSADTLRLRAPFKAFEPDHPLHKALRRRGEAEAEEGGTAYKVSPHIDQHQMFDAVYSELVAGGCIGIFPEGGSHDRPSLLPLKAGAAIIALGTLARDPGCGLTILPCGMNYFHPNKFRSRAVVEFGGPIRVHPDQIAAFASGGDAKRTAVSSLLATIEASLAAVTQQAPDHETLMLVQATRRLYKPLRAKLPLSTTVELNRRLLEGYARFRDAPLVQHLTRSVAAYNRQLRALGVKDHQVEWGDVGRRPWLYVLATLLQRVAFVLALVAGTLPSLALFWPVFVTTKVISVKKQRKALANSSVKLEARDVVGTWKMLVALGLAPALYVWYTAVVSVWLVLCRTDAEVCAARAPPWARATTWVPAWLPLKVFVPAFFALMVAVTFAGLRIGEVGMDVVKSLPPLLVALNPWSKGALVRLRERRRKVAKEVLDVVERFGPEVFEDFEEQRLLLVRKEEDGDVEDGEEGGIRYDDETVESEMKKDV